MRDLVPSPDLRLEPGRTYFVSYGAPDVLLDAAVRHPDWAASAAQYLHEQADADVDVQGAGVAWERPPGGQLQRTFMVRVHVRETDADTVAPQEAGVSLRVFGVALLAAWGIVASLSVVRVTTLLTDPERRELGDHLPTLTWPVAALALGTLTLAAVVAVRYIERSGDG